MKKDEEYWKIDISPEDERDIDLELIEEINLKYPQEDYEVHQVKVRKNRGIKTVALITLTIFSLFLLNNWLQVFNLPSLSFVTNSIELSALPEVKQYKKAIVKIDTLHSAGTGFNIAPEGLIVTNHHVIDDAKTINVIFSSKTSFIGQKFIDMPEVDIAILKVKGNHLPALELAGEDEVVIGDEVLIIGNALGFLKTPVKGEIVGKTPIKEIEGHVLLIRGDIHKGNSGSPVFNKDGKVIGVVFAILQKEYSGDEIIGLAIPIKNVVEELEQFH